MRGYLRHLRSHVLEIGRLFWMSTALLLALAVIAGVLLGGSGFVPSSLTLAVAMAAALLAAVVARGHRVVWLPCALLAALALGLWRDEAARLPTGTAGLAYYSGRDVTIVGTVTGEPEVLDRGETIRLAVESLTLGSGAPRHVSGTVLAHLGALTPLSYGDRLSLGGTLAPPPILPGGSGGAYRAYLAAQGIVTVMDFPRLQRLGGGNGNPLLALAIALRSLMERGIQHVLPAPENALLLGILLGTRTRALGTLTAPFVATGMIHVVAVDGLKVSLMQSHYSVLCLPHRSTCLWHLLLAYLAWVAFPL